LGLLGFVCEIKEFERDHGTTLMVYTAEKDRLLGRNGALLEDIQLLLNRVLLAQDKNAGKVQVDIEHWREMKDDALAHRVRQIGVSAWTAARARMCSHLSKSARNVLSASASPVIDAL